MTSRVPQAARGSSAPTVGGLVGWVALVAVYVMVCLIAYFRLPAARVTITDIGVAVALVVAAIGLLVWLFVRQVRRIPTADAPMVRSLSAVVLVFVPFVLLFSYIYLSLAERGRQMVGIDTHLDALYFTVTMLTTVGFGDISPSGQLARAVATTQMLFNLIFLGFIVRVAIQVGQDARRRRGPLGAASGTARLGERDKQWQASPRDVAGAERDEP